MSIYALPTIEERVNIFNSDKIYFSAAIGVGILIPTSSRDGGNTAFTDVVIPLKINVEYRFTKNLSIGINTSFDSNINAFRTRSLFHVGFLLGFRF